MKGDRHSIAISRQQTEVTLRLKNDKAMYKVTAIKQDAGENGKLLVGAGLRCTARRALLWQRQ